MIFRTGLTATQRTFWMAAFALLIGMRLLTPAGFMPSWSVGQIQISLCDEAGAQVAALAHHGDHNKTGKSKHAQPCPFAAAAATPFLTLPAIALALPLAPSANLERSAYVVRLSRQRKVERPPSRAPPLLV